ncbi:MAG: ABC transporter permease, partial [Fibrobacterota bacterium]
MISPGKGSSPVSRAFRRIKKDRLAVISLAVIIFYAVIALLAASGVIFSDYGLKTGESYQAPSAEHLAGTDFMGRDVLARTVHGSKISMSV